ncbi:MAG TPA: surface-adhesin E family protein [Gemmatimonadaceae bacterium]|nr:surface-adhesin E family protein [Gemmatimonadaceae bacterium]
MKRYFLIATLIALPVTAENAAGQAAWPVILRNANVTVALDTANAKRNADGSYMTRTRWDYARLRALESKRPYLSMTQTALLRCTPVRIKRLTESFYAANGAVVREGEAPHPGDIQYMTWDRIKTGTDGSRAMNQVCALLRRRDGRR